MRALIKMRHPRSFLPPWQRARMQEHRDGFGSSRFKIALIRSRRRLSRNVPQNPGLRKMFASGPKRTSAE
jgi:hypothetical protein